MTSWLKWAEALFHLVYPRYCICCNGMLVQGESWVCQHCAFDMPFVPIDDHADNEIAKVLAGRLPFRHAQSVLYFQKGNKTQDLLHQLKYKGNKTLGIDLGKMAAWHLRNTSVVKADAIVPVPLHPDKHKERGYNQSEILARGMHEILAIPVWTDVVVRQKYTSTQPGWGGTSVGRMSMPYSV